MTIDNMAFVPATGLRDTATYPTKPLNEASLRDAIQDQSDQLRDYINTVLKAKLISKTDGTSGADEIGATPIVGIGDANTDTVQEILEAIKTYVDSGFITVANGYTKAQIDAILAGIVLGQIPDGSIGPIKLSFDPATQAELDVITNQIVSVAAANKLLKLDANSKLPADITGESAKVNGVYFRNNAGALEWSADNVTWNSAGGAGIGSFEYGLPII